MGKKQYLVGKKWEDYIIEHYNDLGYFAYKMPTMTGGTVFDIIIAKNSAVMFVECKHIKGDKLYYVGSGLKKKTDEIEHFIRHSNNNLYLFVLSDEGGAYWTTWARSSELLKKQGYLKLSDMLKAKVN